MSKSHDESDKPKDKWSGRLSNTKEGLEIARQLLVVSVILVLIFAPTVFKSTLAALGVKKIGIAGAEVEVTQEASEKTGDAAQRIEDANKGLKSAQENLDVVIRQTSDEDTRKKLEELSSQLKKSLETTTNAEQNLNDSLAAQTSILQKAAPEDIQAEGAWGIVISADKKLVPDAQDEVKKAQDLGYQTVKVYDRQNFLRTVVEFPSFAEAQTALPKLRSIRSSSYLVNMAKWCPTRKDEGNGIWQCA